MDTEYGIYSEPRSGHWVAWATAGDESRPVGSVILVGQTQEEAEAHAAQWIERLGTDASLLRLPPAADTDAAGEAPAEAS